VLTVGPFWREEFIVGEKADMARLAAGKFNRHHHVGSQQRMFEKQPGDSAILHAPFQFPKFRSAFVFQERRSLVAQTINDVPRSALVVKINLGSWAFEVTVVVKQLQPPQKRLGAVANECCDLGGTEKTVLVDQPDDFAIAVGQLDAGNLGGAFETGKTRKLHVSILPCSSAF